MTKKLTPNELTEMRQLRDARLINKPKKILNDVSSLKSHIDSILARLDQAISQIKKNNESI
jgi:hypothetical protein